MIEAKVVLASSINDIHLITLQLRLPKFLDAEFEKHRMISSNSSSDRAIPFDKMVRQDYYLPTDVRLNEPGMRGDIKLTEQQRKDFHRASKYIRQGVINELRYQQHVHKQTLNRFLLPWSMQSKVATATRDQWEYFLSLRLSEEADPAMQELAGKISRELNLCSPIEMRYGTWHLPYITDEEADKHEEGELTLEVLKDISVARCARVSYNNHDGTACNVHSDLTLAATLKENNHMTPFEHQATPMRVLYTAVYPWDSGVTHGDREGRLWSANFRGWIQNRKLL